MTVEGDPSASDRDELRLKARPEGSGGSSSLGGLMQSIVVSFVIAQVIIALVIALILAIHLGLLWLLL
ncbi:MAG: hypothetical protein CMJ83_18110 [Planctomycetes bacterium]|nr:hypothetical protein [Planctomycetota bacterium]